jgi:hypothetical protein
MPHELERSEQGGTMNISDEDLMAYADGEVDGEGRQAVEAVLAADPMLRARVAVLRAQRQRVASAYDGVLDESVPDRLHALLAAQPAPATVVDLAGARARRAEPRGGDARTSWMQWGGMAACVLAGVLLGLSFAPHGDADALLAERSGQVVAGGTLARALGAQLASDTNTASEIAVQLSFVDKSGRYCRTFSSARIAGLACRDAEQWAVMVAARAPGDGATPMRQAASSLPRAVLDAVDERIAGGALNAEQERAARARDWKR